MNLFVTSKKKKPRIHQFANLKCCKVSFKAFKMKKYLLFFKVRINTPSSTLKVVNWWFRFLMSRTGQIKINPQWSLSPLLFRKRWRLCWALFLFVLSIDQALISKREYFLVNLLSELNANHLSLFENNIKNSDLGKYWNGRGHVSTYVAATPKCEWHF